MAASGGLDRGPHDVPLGAWEPRASGESWDAPPAAPLAVRVRFNLNKLTDVDTVRSKAWVSIGVMFYWTDPRLAGWTGELPPALWGPSCWLFNALTDLAEIPQDYCLDDPATGRMRRYCRYMGTVDFKPMRLRTFPLDVNEIDFTFRTASHWISPDGQKGDRARGRSYSVHPVDDTRREGSLFRLLWDGDLQELDLLGVSLEITELVASGSGQEVTNIVVRFHAARRVRFYFWKVGLPIYLLFGLTLSIFAMEVHDIADRLSAMITQFLASFAMLYVVENHLPKTNFLTLIDKVIVLTTVLLLVAAGFMVVVYHFYKAEGTAVAERWNERFAWGLAAFYALVNVLLVVPAYVESRRRVRDLPSKLAPEPRQRAPASGSEQKYYIYHPAQLLLRSGGGAAAARAGSGGADTKNPATVRC